MKKATSIATENVCSIQARTYIISNINLINYKIEKKKLVINIDKLVQSCIY